MSIEQAAFLLLPLEQAASFVARRQFEGLRNKARKFDNPPHLTLIKQLRDVLNQPPFDENQEEAKKKIAVFCDLDNVITDLRIGQANGSITRLLALRTILRRTDNFTLISSRITLAKDSILWTVLEPTFGGTISKLPFLTDDSAERIKQFLINANGTCTINLGIGLKKLVRGEIGGQSLASAILKFLSEGNETVVIGSSFVERRIVGKMLDSLPQEADLSKLHYFDTGRLLI